MPDAAAVWLTSGTLTTGHWCDTCQLPSGVVAPMLRVATVGVSVLGWWRRCIDCGATLPEPVAKLGNSDEVDSGGGG